MSARAFIRFLSMDGEALWGSVPASSSWLSSPTQAAHAGQTVDVVSLSSFMPQFPGGGEAPAETAKVSRLLAPIPTPNGVAPVIYGIGLNYRKHALEIGAPVPDLPVVFMKNPQTASGPFDPIRIPKCATSPPELDYEVELCVVIGRECRDVTAASALDYVLGYTITNDVTARRWQGPKGGGQWCFSKSFNSFSPLGPAIHLQKDIGDPNKPGLRLTTKVNGETRQDSSTEDMIFSVAQLIAFLSQDSTLPPGTLIFTGTPSGVGFKRDPPMYLAPKDDVVLEIQGLGTLCNRVEATQ